MKNSFVNNNRAEYLFKGKKCAAFLVLILLIFCIGLWGCGSDEPAAESGEEGGAESSGPGEGVAGERYTADFNGHTYQFIDEDTTWEEARKMCIARGGHLATVTSAEEQKYLEGLFNNINGNERGPWFGAYSDGAYGGDKNDWCWVTGEKWNYTNWADGEPSNAEGTEWFTHFWNDMKWNDINNDDTRDSQKGYICEYDDLSDVSAGGGSETGAEGGAKSNGPGVAGEKYTADFNGHTYQFIDEDTTWEEARKMCITRGGHLVTVTSSDEEEYLKGLYLNINGGDEGGWLGAYSYGAYGGDKNDWCWVTGEKWNYTNWDKGEPSNSRGKEWFAHFWKDMTWNDVDNEDSRGSQKGYICEYDDLSDVSAGSGSAAGSDPPEMEVSDSELDSDWAAALQESVEEDPFYKDLGDGRTAIQSHWRGVQIKYPSSYFADEDGDALYVYDGDAMYVYARNITTAAEDNKGDLASFCAAKAEDQVVRDFTKLFGAPTNTDGVNREGGDGKKRVCVITGNMWNGNADMHFKSKVVISGKKNNFLVMYTAFWRYGDQVSADHYSKIAVTSWGKGDMYGQ